MAFKTPFIISMPNIIKNQSNILRDCLLWALNLRNAMSKIVQMILKCNPMVKKKDFICIKNVCIRYVTDWDLFLYMTSALNHNLWSLKVCGDKKMHWYPNMCPICLTFSEYVFYLTHSIDSGSYSGFLEVTTLNWLKTHILSTKKIWTWDSAM